MAPLVVPGVARYTIHGTFDGANVANVLDMHIDTTVGFDRDDCVRDQADVIINEWKDHILEDLTAAYSFTKVSWVDLNSLSGSVGEESSTGSVTLPQAGENAAQAMPANVAIKVDKVSGGGRGTRKGRMYLVGCRESDTPIGTPNTLDAAFVTSWNADLAAFLSGINQTAGGTPSYDSELVVVHTAGGAFTTYDNVTSLVVQPKLASQRRRLN